ncbi:MAG: hypothetical protein IJA72_03140, partial [Clostridia bacterium]|nr:hypothetical protein [Clostridia bacterium]
RVYARVNAEARNGESADATYPGKTYELSTANAYIDALVQTEVAGGYVVGYFKDTNFNADSVISFGDKVYAKDIPSDITKDSEGAGIIYLLVSKTSFSLVHTSNLQVGNYTWQSEYVASTVKTIKLGQIIDLTTQDEYDTQFEKILKRTDNYNEAEEEILSSCQYYILQTGKSSSNKRFSLVDVNDRNNVIKDLIDLRLYYKPTDENTKIQLQGEEVVFNIYDSTDLEKFAKEVNNGFMNKATKDLDGDGWCYYTAVLKNTLKETYTGPSIGTQASPFMGTFNGNGQTIESIVMPTTGTATIFGFFQEVQHGKISDLKIDSIGPSTVSVKGASCIGALCAYANNAIFEKIVINEIYLNIKYTATDGNLYVGGLVGKCSNTTFDEIHLNENKITMSGSKDADETNHYFGGIVGYSANTSYRGITNKYKLSGTWPKLNGGNFYGGGIVGYAYWVNEFDPISDDLAMINVVNENISDDSKDDAEQSYQLYNTNSIYIGGLIGYAAGSGYRIIDSQNNADIIADFAASSSANANSDTVHLGGLIGCIGNGSSGVQIENCRNTGDIKNAQTDNTNRALRIGGLFGGIYEQKTTVNNCSVFNNTLDIAFKNKSGSPTWAGLFVGAVNCSASNTINFNNCYASLADIVKTSSSAGASLSGHYGYFPSNQNPNNLTFSNCYAMGNFIYKGTSGEERILPDGEGIDHRNGIGVKKEYYGSREPTENNGESYVNEILNLNENGKYLYGYNTAINSVSENLSTPFAITEYFKSTGTNSQPTASYVNVIIDCSSYATQESSIHVSGTDGQGQFYNYKNQYFYGTGLLMMESGTRYPMKLPELTGKINGSEVAVSGYSLSEDNPEIEFIPGQEFAGDLIGVSDIYSNETIRLYPVFAPSVQVYTTTKIKNNIDTATRPIQVGDRVYVSGDTYTRVFVEDTSANTNNYPYYEISAINEIEEENSLYKYVYTITYNDTYNDATEYKSNLDCRAIFQLFGGIYTTSGIQSGFFKTSLDE